MVLVPTVARAQKAMSPAGKQATAAAAGAGAPSQLPLKFSGGATVGEITPRDLMTRLYQFADDSMMGREAGTPWNDKGTDYIARELRRLGLKPGGEDGSYFQYPLIVRDLAPGASLSVGGSALAIWKDVIPRDQGDATHPFDGAATVYGGRYGDTASYLDPAAAQGKTVVIMVGNGPDGRPNPNAIDRQVLTRRYASAAAIAVIYIDYIPAGYIDAVFRRPNVLEKGVEGSEPLPAYFYVTRDVAQTIFGTNPDSLRTGATGAPVNGAFKFEQKVAPGRNVIAILPGSDPKLRDEYVVIGAHNDHVGFSNQPIDHDSIKAVMMIAAPQGADSPEPAPTAEQWLRIRTAIDSLRALHPPRPDSIYNGADDDGSGSMSVLEIAESYASGKLHPKRSIMFIWHVGEELGLFGSEYFTDHPTVPRESIVAELNMDMVGRGGAGDKTGVNKAGALLHGGPGYVQLVGSRRLSTELGDLIEKTNADRNFGLVFDYSLDANGHPQNIYCRSDHYEYARYGIPITFFTTGGHSDYHQVTDEPEYIDYDHMARVGRLVEDVTMRVANLDHRIVVDQPKPDPRGGCRQ